MESLWPAGRLVGRLPVSRAILALVFVPFPVPIRFLVGTVAQVSFSIKRKSWPEAELGRRDIPVSRYIYEGQRIEYLRRLGTLCNIGQQRRHTGDRRKVEMIIAGIWLYGEIGVSNSC